MTKKTKHTCPNCRNEVRELANIFDKLYCMSCAYELIERAIEINKTLAKENDKLRKEKSDQFILFSQGQDGIIQELTGRIKELEKQLEEKNG